MLQKFLKVSMLGVLALTVAVSAAAQDKKDEKKLTTKQIMMAGHKGADALFEKVKAAVKDKKWDDASTAAKQLAENGALFPKATPPKGDAKSWEDLSGKYAENTKALAAAVEKKDADAANKAVGTIGSSCMACHKEHRGKK